MRKIYLASDSRARREVLKTFGFKFEVIPSRIKEKRARGKYTYSTLVKKNALKKARIVAERVKQGIIIAADTIVVQDQRIFGKPEHLKAAKIMLKRLSAKPQWLYTGMAVIDKDKRRRLIDYEKTKVYMDKLTDAEIDNYFAHTSPLDKAGSFDIQGSGAFFIRRIEGCFYNIIGLPLRKLYRMLKEIGINPPVLVKGPLRAIVLFYILIFSFSLAGCTTEYNLATKQQETFYYSTDKEEQMGRSIARQVEKEYKLAEDPLLQKRVEDIGKKITAVCDRKEINYYFRVLDDEEVNAVSLPGGYIYINKGLIEKVDNDDQLAGVLAHEVGHIVARHSIKKLQALNSYSILRLLTAVAVPDSGQVGSAADTAFTELMMGYSRDDELLADQLASRYAKLAGYDPHGMIQFLLKLQEINRKKPLQPKTYYKTHPYVPDRVRVVKQEIGESIDFTDYINIEETKGQ
jgi:MAF protein